MILLAQFAKLLINFYPSKSFQNIKEKEFVAISDVGAYGMSLSSNYNLRPKPSEIMINNKSMKVNFEKTKVNQYHLVKIKIYEKKIFSIVFYSGVILVCIIFLPSLIMPKSIVIFGGKILGYWSKFCLKFFLSTKINIIGKENILNNEKFFIACTHQSAFETFYLQALFKGPKFILKKGT